MYTHVALKIRYNKRQIFTSMFMNIHTCVHVTDSLAYTLCDRYSIHLLRTPACFLYHWLSFDPSLSSLSFSLFIFSFTHMVTHICPSRNHAYMCLVSSVSLDHAVSYSSLLSHYPSYMLSLTHMRAPHAHVRTCVSYTH